MIAFLRGKTFFYCFARTELLCSLWTHQSVNVLYYVVAGVHGSEFLVIYLLILLLRTTNNEGLPRVLGNKGTVAKYRREQGNISQFLGTGEQNSKNYSTKTFGKCVGTFEHRAILEGNKDPPPPPPPPSITESFNFQIMARESDAQ